MYALVKWVNIGSDNGLSPGRRQAIFLISAGILLIGPLGTNFGEIWIDIRAFHLKKCIWKCRLGKMIEILSWKGNSTSQKTIGHNYLSIV